MTSAAFDPTAKQLALPFNRSQRDKTKIAGERTRDATKRSIARDAAAPAIVLMTTSEVHFGVRVRFARICRRFQLSSIHPQRHRMKKKRTHWLKSRRLHHL